MSRVLKISFPDISYCEKTRLVGHAAKDLKVSKGASSIYVRNPTGFAVGDFLILEAFESEDAEVVRIYNIQADSHVLDLYTPLVQDHSVGSMGLPGVVVMKTSYNQVKIFKGTTNDVSLHTEITTKVVGSPPTTVSDPVALRPDNAYTYYVDDSGVITDFYSYQYWNSATSTGSSRTLYQDSDYDSILTVEHLKNHFMFGLDLTDDDGYPFPNSMFEFAIRAAVDSLEKTLQVKLKRTTVFEYQDFFAQDYRDFCFLQLNNWPVISVEKIQIQYPTAAAPVEFPLEWVQLRKERGSLHLVPTQGSLSTILMGKGGDYLTFVWRGFDFMPNLWRIWYTAGFENGMDGLNDVIGIVGKLACFYPLNLAGDLVGGIAIASKSIGIDGLSQSINTTSSPENAGYCLINSNIYTDSGKVEFKDLVGKQPYVLGMKDGKIIKSKASKVWLTNRGKSFWKILFNNSIELGLTKGHLVMMKDGTYKNTKDLKVSDIVMSLNGGLVVEKIYPDFGVSDVYDMEVSETKNFIANGVVVHNSARLRQYERELRIEIPRLQQFFKGLRMAVL